ncbi:MAG: hypothetical protein SV686_08970 [Thermodesulfobacteriota bacterium]|nr:hypothetical protein [Thermodesulfobacteriota bacterium]
MNKDVIYCEGTVTREKKKEDPKIREPLKDRFLPLRKVWAFDNGEEATAYVQEALTHLLQDKGYEPRKRHGASADYGLVVVAFQESLGVPLRKQMIWISRNVEFLCSHRNRVYSFTIYPRARELIQFFVVTTPQWSLVRSRYVANRGKQEKT